MKANYHWQQETDQGLLAERLAQALGEQINISIASKGGAVIALSGGSTPKPLFKAMTKLDIDWSKVFITLVDERWVDASHDLSNAAFLKRHLLDHLPSQPNFIPLYCTAESALSSLTNVLSQYCSLTGSTNSQPREFDAVVLGMGSDGHTASFFPDAGNIGTMLNPNASDYLYSCYSPSTQVDRVTWSLPMLLNTSFLALHMTGQNKKTVFDEARETAESFEQICQLPIRSVLFQDQTPLTVFYAD